MRRRIALLLLTRLHFGSLVWGKVVACERYGVLEVGVLLAGDLLSIRGPEVTVLGEASLQCLDPCQWILQFSACRVVPG